jgi:hypothetical protein
MTDADGLGPLPTRVTVTRAMLQRVVPPQRLQDEITKLEGRPYRDVYEAQPFRCEAFRVLQHDHPLRDPASLWLHAYDVEVEMAEEDPTNGNSPKLGPPSVATGGAFPEISTT